MLASQNLPLSDRNEADRREFILQHTGKGRLASQDATLPRSAFVGDAFPGPSVDMHDPVSMAEFFAEDVETSPDLARRGSDPGNSLAKKRFSTLKLGALFAPKGSPVGSRRGSVDVMEKDRTAAATPSMSRRGSHDARPAEPLGIGLGVFSAPPATAVTSPAGEC